MLSGVTSCNVRRPCLLRRLVHLWGARAKHAVLMRVSSNMLPQRAACFSDGPIRNHRSWPTPRLRWTGFALRKTRNRLNQCGRKHPQIATFRTLLRLPASQRSRHAIQEIKGLYSLSHHAGFCVPTGEWPTPPTTFHSLPTLFLVLSRPFFLQQSAHKFLCMDRVYFR